MNYAACIKMVLNAIRVRTLAATHRPAYEPNNFISTFIITLNTDWRNCFVVKKSVLLGCVDLSMCCFQQKTHHEMNYLKQV